MPATTIETLTINGRRLTLKNLDKPFWPEEGITKGDIMEYYIKVWPFLAPTCGTVPSPSSATPTGSRQLFLPKELSRPCRGWSGVAVKTGGRVVYYVMANNLETLLWSINLGCIEVHPPTGHQGEP